MKLDDLQQEHVTYLLALWHRWSRASERTASGYARVSAGFSSYRTSRQHDDLNGALDDEADMSLARAVDGEVSSIPDPWRTALHIEARNVDAPARVWATARVDMDQLRQVTAEARGRLWEAMERAGLV